MVIRIRGRVKISRPIEDTLKMLRLKAINNCVILPETPSYKGMLEKVKDYITYGEIDENTLILLLKRRLRLKGGKRFEEKALEEITGYKKIEAFARDLLSGKIRLKDFTQLQPVFRLSPPSKGFKSVKKHYPKGDLGYRGKEINKLLERMI